MLKISKKSRFSLMAGLAVITSLTQQSFALAGQTINCQSTSYGCTSFNYYGGDGNYDYDSPEAKGHNCTSYIAWILWNYADYNPKFNTLGDATTWAKNAKKLSAFGVSVSTTVHPFDVAQWNYGHVAFVEKVNTNKKGEVTSIIVSDDTYNLRVTRRMTITPGSGWPDNFISFPWTGPIGMPPGAQFASLSEQLGESTQLDGSVQTEESSETDY